jgi:dihydrofolate reductase
MRKLVVAEFISLDGVVEAPETWHMQYVNPEMFAIIGAAAATADTMLLGRVTYDGFAGAFADTPEDDPVGAMMNRPTKVVVSTSRKRLEWRNCELLPAGDVVGQIAALKQRPGRNILTTGSTSLVRTMLRAGLVDELDLLVHPVVVGKGERLFEVDGPHIPLELAECTALSTGVTRQVYRKA